MNYTAYQFHQLNCDTNDAEIIVTDWKSDTPLCHALDLSPSAAAMTRFLEIPPECARQEQQDSPFPEVLANNAAIRRARGEFVGRIHSISIRFLSVLFFLARHILGERRPPFPKSPFGDSPGNSRG